MFTNSFFESSETIHTIYLCLLAAEKSIKMPIKHSKICHRKHMSTVDNMLIINGLITHCINNNKYLYCASWISPKPLTT